MDECLTKSASVAEAAEVDGQLTQQQGRQMKEDLRSPSIKLSSPSDARGCDTSASTCSGSSGPEIDATKYDKGLSKIGAVQNDKGIDATESMTTEETDTDEATAEARQEQGQQHGERRETKIDCGDNWDAIEVQEQTFRTLESRSSDSDETLALLENQLEEEVSLITESSSSVGPQQSKFGPAKPISCDMDDSVSIRARLQAKKEKAENKLRREIQKAESLKSESMDSADLQRKTSLSSRNRCDIEFQRRREITPQTKPHTTPKPFHFSTDTRSKYHNQEYGQFVHNDRDAVEMKKQFHARPVPNFDAAHRNAFHSRAQSPKRPVTPMPFNFATERRASSSTRARSPQRFESPSKSTQNTSAVDRRSISTSRNSSSFRQDFSPTRTITTTAPYARARSPQMAQSPLKNTQNTSAADRRSTSTTHARSSFRQDSSATRTMNNSASRPKPIDVTEVKPFHFRTDERVGRSRKTPVNIHEIRTPKQFLSKSDYELMMERRSAPKKYLETKPFHFATDDRFSKKQQKTSPSHEKKPSIPKFHANPVPNFEAAHDALPDRPIGAKQPVKAQPFHFATDDRLSRRHSKTEPSPKEEGITKRFHARPVPDFDAAHSALPDRCCGLKKPLEIKPFHFATDDRMGRRHTKTNPEPSDGNEITRFQAIPVPDLNAAHDALPDRCSGLKKPVEAKPFHLSTDARGRRLVKSRSLTSDDRKAWSVNLNSLSDLSAAQGSTKPNLVSKPTDASPTHTTVEPRHRRRHSTSSTDQNGRHLIASPTLDVFTSDTRSIGKETVEIDPVHLASDKRRSKSETSLEEKMKKRLEEIEKQRKALEQRQPSETQQTLPPLVEENSYEVDDSFEFDIQHASQEEHDDKITGKSGSNESGSSSKRACDASTTEPKPFNFMTEKRASRRPETPSSEMKITKAKYADGMDSGISEKQQRNTTEPKPFNFATERRAAKQHRNKSRAEYLTVDEKDSPCSFDNSAEIEDATQQSSANATQDSLSTSSPLTPTTPTSVIITNTTQAFHIQPEEQSNKHRRNPHEHACHVTKPKPFSFMTDKRAARKDKEKKLLEKKMKREETKKEASERAKRREFHATEPKPFTFMTDKRAAAKNLNHVIEALDEKDLGDNRKQFQARALPTLLEEDYIMDDCSVHTRCTLPRPFHLKTDERAEKSVRRVVRSAKEIELEECKKQFHALPLPTEVKERNSSPMRLYNVRPTRKFSETQPLLQPTLITNERSSVSSIHCKSSIVDHQRRSSTPYPTRVHPSTIKRNKYQSESLTKTGHVAHSCDLSVRSFDTLQAEWETIGK